jgi:hypothetical protein
MRTLRLAKIPKTGHVTKNEEPRTRNKEPMTNNDHLIINIFLMSVNPCPELAEGLPAWRR